MRLPSVSDVLTIFLGPVSQAESEPGPATGPAAEMSVGEPEADAALELEWEAEP